MKWRSFILVACVGSLLIALPTQVSRIQVIAQRPPTQLPQVQLQAEAQAITVKILADGFLGSGVIIYQKDQEYWVLTNDHVVQAKIPLVNAQTPSAKIQTADGEVHTAILMWSATSLGKDLAILKFSSPKLYVVAQLGDNPSVGEAVFAAGFPFPLEESAQLEFRLKQGQVSQILEKPLEGGYQIGYTNDVEKGMSGGPLLNGRGEVVSINGLHAHPLWGDPYLFEDGSQPDDLQRETMSQYSWGIPIETVLKLQQLRLVAAEAR